jgi:hypothetical protein
LICCMSSARRNTYVPSCVSVSRDIHEKLDSNHLRKRIRPASGKEVPPHGHDGLFRTAEPGLNIRIGSRAREGGCSYRQGLEREANRVKKQLERRILLFSRKQRAKLLTIVKSWALRGEGESCHGSPRCRQSAISLLDAVSFCQERGTIFGM